MSPLLLSYKEKICRTCRKFIKSRRKASNNHVKGTEQQLIKLIKNVKPTIKPSRKQPQRDDNRKAQA